MIRFLDELAMLREVDMVGSRYSSDRLKAMYPNDVVIINHIAYIYRDKLCEEVRERVTDLDGYVQLGDLVSFLGCHKKIFRDRFKFMEESGVELLRSINLCGVRMIHIEDDIRLLMHQYQPSVISLKDGGHVAAMKLIGDIKIGFF